MLDSINHVALLLVQSLLFQQIAKLPFNNISQVPFSVKELPELFNNIKVKMTLLQFSMSILTFEIPLLHCFRSYLNLLNLADRNDTMLL